MKKLTNRDVIIYNFQPRAYQKPAFPAFLWSISSKFYVCIIGMKVLFLLKSFCQNQNVTREKLLKALLYKKLSNKMLMKLTQLYSISSMLNVRILRTNIVFLRTPN